MPRIVVRCTLPQLPPQDEHARKLFGVSTVALRSFWRCSAWMAVQLAAGGGVRVRIIVRSDRVAQPPRWVMESRGIGLNREAERRIGALLESWSWVENRWLAQVGQLSHRARGLREARLRGVVPAFAFLAALASCRTDYLGGETESTSTSTSTSTDTGSETAGECVDVYGPCSTLADCCSGVCIVQGPGGACLEPCATAAECPPGEGGTAMPYCTSDGCVLACNGGEECPLGMVCGGFACVWPEGEP